MVKAIEVRGQKSEVRGQKSEVRSQKSEVLRRLSPVLCWLAMLIFTFHACTHMVAAGDTWVAMACGRHFVNQGVDTVEPFSANSHKAGPTEKEIQTWPNWAQWITNKVGIETVKYWHPTGWVNQNWLTHVIFYSLIPQSSYADGVSFPSNALVYWKFAIYILTVICVYYTGRLLGVNPALCAVFSCFAMFTGRSFLDIRPAGFSNMLVAVFLLILVLVTYRNVLYIWLVVPVTVFWCNVHGGYIYAFIMLVPFIGLQLITTLVRTRNLIPALFSFSGRMRRKDYWLIGFLVLFPIGIINNVLALNEKTVIFSYIISIFSIWVGFAFFTKRLHDRDRSGWWLATLFIPLAGVIFAIWIIIEVWFLRGTIGPNRFGDDPITESNEISKFIGNKDTLKSIGPIGLYHTIAASIVAFLAMVLFNPFHLTNLTHTFAISVSEHAARWRNIHEWWPAFDWDNLVGDETPFLVMYIIAWVTLAAWAIVLIKTSKSVNRQSKRKINISEEYQRPKIDISIILIAALTIYMAIRSRRFIPIAAIAACPVIAMFIDQLVRAISAAHNFQRNKRLIVSVMPYNLQLFFTLAGAVAVLFFGTWWGLKFKRIYLDSWPRDPKLTSMFMRMTDSGQKPFYATKFIKDNKLQGNMLNYWTEGGFIAFGQEPDPNTGRTPLQLFMDGRAQAAYNREAFEEWSTIMAGGLITGQIAARAEARRQSVSSDDYVKIGQWMDEQLRGYNVWVVLMPQGEYRTPPPQKYYRKMSYHAIQGIERNPNWRLVFFNNKQKLFVDVRTPRGKELFDGIFNGKTLYPNDFHANLIRAHSWLFYRRGIAEKKKGFDFAVKAFNLNPSPAPMREIMLVASRFAEIKLDVNKFCENYVREFTENEADWAELDGYRDRVEAARLACFYLGDVARTEGNTKLANIYAAQEEKCLGELLRVAQSKRW